MRSLAQTGRALAVYATCLAQARPHDDYHLPIRECGSTLYVGMAHVVLLSLYIGIGTKSRNTRKIAEYSNKGTKKSRLEVSCGQLANDGRDKAL